MKTLWNQRNPSKLSLYQRREVNLRCNRNRFCSTSKMKTLQDTSKNSVRNWSLQPAKNVPTETLTESVFVRPAGTRTTSPWSAASATLWSTLLPRRNLSSTSKNSLWSWALSSTKPRRTRTSASRESMWRSFKEPSLRLLSSRINSEKSKRHSGKRSPLTSPPRKQKVLSLEV